MTEVLSRRALNRALLGRQHLLGRVIRPVPEVIEHLVAMQAQVPVDPLVALWSRLVDFDPQALSTLIADRRAVRGPLHRATLHLVTDRDFLAMRPLVQPVLERGLYHGSPFGRRLEGMDVEALLAAARALVDEKPRTRAELRRLLGPQWPERDAESLAYAVTYLEPMVQVPPRGLWERSGQSVWARSATWLATSEPADLDLDRFIQRYLAAFGPASVQDAQNWCGLTRLTPVFERLRPELVTFRDEGGREVFDLPEAPRPDPETPAPVRFLPQYDNILLGHADRSRIVPDIVQGMAWPEVWVGTILVDGMVAGTWRIRDEGKTAALEIFTFEPLVPSERDALAAEGEALAAFLRPKATSRSLAITLRG